MNPPIICPHCHSLIDPLMLETAVSATARYHVCPECDSPIILFADSMDDGPADAEPPGVLPTKNHQAQALATA